ncbi:hypothetical protein V499_06691, partial [Pseudogymnoascus sp. VKM F-103]
MAETVECWWLAKRADDIASALTRIRLSLTSSSHADITNVISEVLHSGSLLRDLSDLLRIYRDRVSLVRGFLGILAPCFERSVEDIRPSMYEATVLKSLIEKTLRLRAARGIEAPRILPLLPLSSQVRIQQPGRIHWAQQIFD